MEFGQPNFARCLADSCAGTLYLHFRGFLPLTEFLPAANFTLRPSLALSCIGSVTARHSNSGRQPKFAAWYKEWNYGTFATYSAGQPSRWASAHILVRIFRAFTMAFIYKKSSSFTPLLLFGSMLGLSQVLETLCGLRP